MKQGKHYALIIMLLLELNVKTSVLRLVYTTADRVESINNWYFCDFRTHLRNSHRQKHFLEFFLL